MRPDDTATEVAVRIPLRARDGSVRAHAIVDPADAAWVNQWRWCMDGKGYAVRAQKIDGRKNMVFLHRELLGLVRGDGLAGDHINRDRLDDRRSNLRAIPRAANVQNQGGNPSASSPYRGVTPTLWGRWRARVRVAGKLLNFGTYGTQEEAAAAARAARRQVFPYAVD
jgi:hypothetical protein